MGAIRVRFSPEEEFIISELLRRGHFKTKAKLFNAAIENIGKVYGFHVK